MTYDLLFRTLDPTEEDEFRAWARDNWRPDTDPNPMWHPVVREEWARLTEAAANTPDPSRSCE